jgi:hypothetical protein
MCTRCAAWDWIPATQSRHTHVPTTQLRDAPVYAHTHTHLAHLSALARPCDNAPERPVHGRRETRAREHCRAMDRTPHRDGARLVEREQQCSARVIPGETGTHDTLQIIVSVHVHTPYVC